VKKLVIDTATRACSVALFEDESCLASFHEDIGRGHAERLVPMVAALPDKGRADAIHVNVGPGSFTGIRVGISAARALALAWSAECHGYGCLDLVAAMAVELHPPLETFAVAMIGGHGEYFVQFFDADGYNGMQTPISLPMDQALSSLKPFRFIAGDAAEKFIAALGRGSAIPLLPDAKYWTSLLDDYPSLPPSPRYIRPPDAKLPGGITP
jgi:tRNA threonylcarbamoyladenosine biosynthesis protein TsaB